MKHLGNESYCWRFIGILFREFYRQLERAVLEGRVVRTENHSIPYHDIVIGWRTRDARRWIFLESTKASKTDTHKSENVVMVIAE